MGFHQPGARYEQLELRMEPPPRPQTLPPAPRAPTPIEADAPPERIAERPLAPREEQAGREPFGRWLLSQHKRGDWIDALAAAARADAGFPKTGTADAVRARLHALGADGDAFEQVDDAERAWLSR